MKQTKHMEKKVKKIDTKAAKVDSLAIEGLPSSMTSMNAWKKWQAKKDKLLQAHMKMVDRKFRIARRWMEANKLVGQ